jgi:hypothetical protein
MMTTSTGPAACGGVVARICDDVTEVMVPGFPPNVTIAPAWKPDPVMVTGVPPMEGPVLGLIDVGLTFEVSAIAVRKPSPPATKSVPSAIASFARGAGSDQTAP